MSTNYYFLTKNKDIVTSNGLSYEITDTPDWGYWVHIGKRSHGWKPIFQAHDGIHSLEDLLAILSSPDVTIYNEYMETLTFEELKEALIDWNKDNPEAISHIEYQKAERLKNPNSFYWHCEYVVDNEGYEFLVGDFC